MPMYALTTGQIINMNQNEVYAMPAGLCFLQVSAAVEASIDNTTWAALAGANTTGIATSARFIRCTTGAAKACVERYA